MEIDAQLPEHRELSWPMPIIIGAPRSGTTLLRLMLDAHPELAVPPETGFLPALAALVGDDARDPKILARTILEFPPDAPAWGDFGLVAGYLSEAIAAVPTPSPTDAARCFYRLYAARFGKRRWGDKTPGHAFSLPAIERLLPEAAFIHLIRDGRGAALSLRPLWFAPASDMAGLAKHWLNFVTAARNGGALCGRYMELRYESLIRDPELELRRICRFLELTYNPMMAQPHLRAAQRLAEHRERRRVDGTLIVNQAMRLAQQWRCTIPSDLSRIRAWRDIMSREELASFRDIAGTLLAELGYED